MSGRLEQEKRINREIEDMLIGMPKFVKDWQIDLMARQFTPKTRKEYLIKVKRFLSFINDNIKYITTDEINRSNINQYMISCQTVTNRNGQIVEASYSYISGVYVALNNFCTYLSEVNYISPIKLTKPIRKNYEIRNEKQLLTEEDFEKILNIAKEKDNYYFRWRDQAILALFMTTGMRLGGLQTINVEDLNFETQELTVIDKGHKPHIYVLNDKTMEILKRYMKERKIVLLGSFDRDALFLTVKRAYGTKLIHRMSEKSISKIVQTCTKKALGKELRPHQLRAGYCSILYDKTGDIEFVRRSVGHSRVETTQRYIKVDENQVRERAASLMGNFL